MLGWTEITADPKSEQYLSYPFTTDGDSAALLALGARADGTIRESYMLLDADLFVGDYRRVGWRLPDGGRVRARDGRATRAWW